MASKIDCSTYLFSGDGHLLIGERDAAGKPMGLRFMGNATSLEVTLEATKEEKVERCSGARGVLAAITTEQKGSCTYTLDDFSAENLAIYMRGDHNKVAAGIGATVTNRGIGLLGSVIPLDHIMVSNVVVTIAGGGAMLEIDKNYTVNLEHGSINILADQAAGAPATPLLGTELLDITYDYAAQENVQALTQAAKPYWFRFEGLNRADNNRPVNVNVFKHEPDLISGLPLMHEAFGEWSSGGSMLIDSLRTNGSQFFDWTYTRP